MSIFGNPVMLGDSSGGTDYPWNDNFAINWDFSNPVNTRGQSSYSSGSSIRTINGWQLYNSTLELVSGGVTTSPNANNYQFPNSSIVVAFLGKTCTLSILAGDELKSVTFVCGSSAGMLGEVNLDNLVRAWSYRDSSTQFSISFGYTGSGTSPIIKSIKLELGETSTLGHMENGVWVLNNTTTQEQETVKGSILSAW